MQQKGKFILLELNELVSWLKDQNVSRHITLIQNHHTYIPEYKNFNGKNHFELQQGMENAHLQRGFAEIAQNFTTFPDGRIMTGRALDKIPAGIKGANSTGICIENLGNFDKGADSMTGEQKNTIIQLNASLCEKFKLARNTDHIVYHHWYDLNTGVRTNGTGSTKSCPGSNFFGGNTLEDAKKNFIPLIEQAYTALQLSQQVGPNPLRTAHVIADKLNVRSGPSTSDKVVKVLNKGISINVYADKAGWCKIDKAEELWVSAKYLG